MVVGSTPRWGHTKEFKMFTLISSLLGTQYSEMVVSITH